MDEMTQQLAMGSMGGAQVVVLARDPEVVYVYWECPKVEEGAEIAVKVREGVGECREVDRIEIEAQRGGRFLRLERPGAKVCCELRWAEGVVDSAWVELPRRRPGSDPAAFVRVKWTEQGLAVSPTSQEGGIYGSFKRGRVSAPSSQSFGRQGGE